MAGLFVASLNNQRRLAFWEPSQEGHAARLDDKTCRVFALGGIGGSAGIFLAGESKGDMGLCMFNMEKASISQAPLLIERVLETPRCKNDQLPTP